MNDMINRHYKILWAEDDSTLREVMMELLCAEGFICTPAADGIEARDWLMKENFDVLITDFNMPRMDGSNLLFWCRQNEVHLPVIFVTATVERLPIEELALNDCCSSVVNKPFAIEYLLEEIDKALNRNHEFHCRGKALPLDQGDYKSNFPGQHLTLS